MKNLKLTAMLLIAALTLHPIAALALEAPSASDMVRAVIVLEKSLSPAQLEARLPEASVVHTYSALFPGMAVQLPQDDLDALREMPEVASAFSVNTYEAPKNASFASTEAFSVLENKSSDNSYYGQNTLVAVLDTGLDLSHSAFDPDAQVLGSTVLKKDSPELEKTFVYGSYLSAKLPFVYDYGDMDGDVTDPNGHGTAMAGRIGGYDPDAGDSGYSGIAPGAQLAIMKIYPDNANTTSTDVIFAAMEDAYVLGADVIAVSFGKPCGFSYDSDLETEAFGNIIEKLEKAGVLVCCGAGDFGSQADHNTAGSGSVLPGYADYGAVASPAAYGGVVSAASAQNTVAPRYVLEVGRDRIPYRTATGQETALTEALGGQRYSFVLVGGTGEASDYDGLDVAGKLAVVKGGKDLSLLANTAAEQGARALVVIGNSTEGLPEFPPLPVVFVSPEDSHRLSAAHLKTVFIPTEKLSAEMSSAAGISTFSSWGTTPELTISPTISGVGEDVLAPKAGGDYSYFSDTAMAAAEAAGSCAALLSSLKAQDTLTAAERAQMAKAMLESTAEVLSNTSVRQQGAGLIALEQAVNTPCYIESPLLELGDDPQETGVYTMELTVKNTAMVGVERPSAQFTDVDEGDWFRESVDNVVHEGLFKGISDTEFSPDSPLTRGQLVTILYRLEEEPTIMVLSSFSDVPTNSYYARAVSWAKEQGIVTGVTPTLFFPDAPVTREQMVTILYRYNGMPQTTASLRDYKDRNLVSDYAQSAMAWAVEKGIVNSTSSISLLLSPKDYATRAQFATILTRFLDQNPVIASYTPYAIVLGDSAEEGKNTLTAQALDCDVRFSCGDTLELHRWTEEETVTVTVRLSGTCCRRLHQQFPNGTFVEGFVGFRGEESDIHGTFLSFYGDWTAAPILEPTTSSHVVQEKYSMGVGAGESYSSKLPLNTGVNTASLYCTSKFSANYGKAVSFLGENPVGPEPYLADRCALSNSEDAMAQALQLQLMQLRNARSVSVTIQDNATGQYYLRKTYQDSRKSQYSAESSSWMPAQVVNWEGTDQKGEPLPNGTAVTISVYASLAGERQHLEWRFSCVIDTEPPELRCDWNEAHTALTVTAQDDRYLAGVIVEDIGGQVLRQEHFGDKETAVSHTLELDMTEIDGSVTLRAVDYAGNITTLTEPPLG